MGVLIISFGVWGIADIFRGFGQSTLAKVGSTEISINEFRQTYTDRLQQIGRQFGRPLTQDQARAFGLDRSGAAADHRGSRTRRGGAPARARPVRRRDHARHHERSQLQGLERRLRSAALPGHHPQFGFTEQRYVADQRRVSLRRQIAGTITAGLEPPRH